MPEYSNTVLPHTPSKSHNIYLLSLYDLDKTIFDIYNMSLGSSVNNKKGSKIKNYMWDLYDLADRLNLQRNVDNHYYIDQTAPWRKVLCTGFNDDSGSNIYTPLRNFFPLSVSNHPLFSGQQYSGSFGFSPLINIAISDIADIVSNNYPGINQELNDQAAGEFLIYLACKIPLFPLMICSSVRSHYSFGPIFLGSIRFNASGQQSLGAVSVECSFQGGKCIMSPEITTLNKRKPGIEPVILNVMKDLNGNNIVERASAYSGIDYDYHRYRSATLLDVIIDEQYHSSYASLKGTITTLKPPAYKIIDFSMTISQSIEFTFTNPMIANSTSVEYMGDDFGPKFASLRSRTVEGTITYFGYNKSLDAKLANTSGLSVYFGGPFFFAMKNVDWSNPSVRINPGGGYTHTYTFKARLPEFDDVDGIHVSAINSDLTKTHSEFSGSSAFSVKDYIDSLARNVFGISY